MPLPDATEIVCPLPDGRRLTAAAYGPRDAATTVLYQHGTGACRWEASFFDEAAHAVGVRVVGVDRPSCGGSTPVADRRMADWPADLLAVADHLDLDRFVVAGLSGGGPHAMAVAAAAPERVIRCVPINSGPPSTPEVLARLDRKIRSGPALARRMPWLFDKVVVTLMANERLATKLAESQVPQADLDLIADPEFAAVMEAIKDEGQRHNPRFFAEALLLWAQDWPMDPFALPVPATVVTGAEDPYRPFAEALAARNADADLLVIPGGHLASAAPGGARLILDAVAHVS